MKTRIAVFESNLWLAIAVAAVCFLHGASSIAAAAEISVERQREILRDGIAAFDGAVEIARDDPAAAIEGYRKAATAFETLIENGVRNAALEYNAGNAHMRMGDLGNAILHYRRAERIAPGDRNIEANLGYARNRVVPAIGDTGEGRLLRNLFFWHYGTSLPTRFWAAALLGISGWTLLLVRMRWMKQMPLSLCIASVALAMLSAGSAMIEIRAEQQTPAAVTMAGEHVLRLGKGEGYEAALREPLGPGVEMNVINRHGDWVEVRLRNGQTGWLPEKAIERV